MKKLFLGFILFLAFVHSAYAQETAQLIFDAPTAGFAKGESKEVALYLQSSTNVNALELHLTYPSQKIKLISINTDKSKFQIRINDGITEGGALITRGNIQGIKGKNLVALLTFQTQQSTSLTELSYSPESVVMSEENVNILTGSLIKTVPVVTPSDKAHTNPPITVDSSYGQKLKNWNINFWTNTGGKIIDGFFGFFERLLDKK